ncbi:auxilin-like clathrin-binding protein required for normal clathrin function [Coemansia sp. RSA 1200]|nr:auxilin-like clathrin-binding protein required for normal clathrin function [Coemansia sp. RSA 1200]
MSNSFSTGTTPSNSQHQKSNKDDDPFGELVSFSSGNSSSLQKTNAKMTLRERQQVLQTQSTAGSAAKSSATAAQADMWNFDVLEQASNSSRSNAGTPVPQKPPRGITSTKSPADLDPLVSGSAQTPISNSDIMSGLDLLSDSPMEVPSPKPSSSVGNSRTGTAAPKRTGLHKDPFNLEVAESSDEDNVQVSQETHRPSRPAASDSFADNDYEISQIAGYGFSVEQAHAALEITGSVRASIQLLREQQATENRLKGQKKPRPVRQKTKSRYRDDSDGQDVSSDDSDVSGYHYNDPHRRPEGASGPRPVRKTNASDFDGKDGTDAFLSTASDIGTSVWKQANSWFAMGKKKIIEIQESVMEQSNKPGTSVGFGGHGGRQDAFTPPAQRYRDYGSSSSEDEQAYVSANRRGRRAIEKVQQSIASKESNRSNSRYPSSSTGASPAQNESILDPDAEVSSIATTPVLGQTQFVSQSSSNFYSDAPRKFPSATPATIPSVSGIILQQANLAKASANEKFKLGQFGDAIVGYTGAIDHILQNSNRHPILIVLFNNRALACTRNGEARNALSDCSKALELCDVYKANGTVDLGSAGKVDIVEQRSKSLNRRAEAHESDEKYKQALDDWKVLRETARDAGTRQQANSGIQRCEKSLGINRPSAAKSGTSSARSTATPAGSANPEEDISSVFAAISLNAVKNSGGITILNRDTENSAAVAEMRRKEQKKQAEDDQRFALTDEVDAELKRWKDGKQQNLRALLSSLHTLLPDFKPIGMHEILEPSKVKRSYMRAIAKLHPDKLNKDLDVRTKMISSSVFSSLNEAWDVFKAQEGQS